MTYQAYGAVMSSLRYCISGATAAALLLCSEAPSLALTVTESAAFFPVLQVDGGSLTTDLTISGLTSTIANVLVTVNLTKCGGVIGSGSISQSGACSSDSVFSANREIFLSLTSPSLIERRMVAPLQLTGQTPGDTVTWSFQDSFSSPVGGGQLVSGDYQPLDSFSSFIGQTGNGIWSLTYGDAFLVRPLSINSWSLSVTDSSTSADVPGPLPLFGLAAAFGWSRLLRKRIRARRDLRSGS